MPRGVESMSSFAQITQSIFSKEGSLCRLCWAMPKGWITISDSNEMADITFPSEQTAFMTVKYGAENLVVILNF